MTCAQCNRELVAGPHSVAYKPRPGSGEFDRVLLHRKCAAAFKAANPGIDIDDVDTDWLAPP